MKLYIKNMVCPRCIMAVENIFRNLKIETKQINLGEVILASEISGTETLKLKEELEAIGFELLSDNQQQLVEKIKTIIIENIQSTNGKHLNFSEILADKLNKEYSQISKLFSTVECVTIEQYVILQKIEKTKELLTYDEKTLSEIAFMLGYSSNAHLSSQFKKTTGLTPSQFKKQGGKFRIVLDKIK